MPLAVTVTVIAAVVAATGPRHSGCGYGWPGWGRLGRGFRGKRVEMGYLPVKTALNLQLGSAAGSVGDRRRCGSDLGGLGKCPGRLATRACHWHGRNLPIGAGPAQR